MLQKKAGHCWVATERQCKQKRGAETLQKIAGGHGLDTQRKEEKAKDTEMKEIPGKQEIWEEKNWKDENESTDSYVIDVLSIVQERSEPIVAAGLINMPRPL